jgi:hypothetical protein
MATEVIMPQLGESVVEGTVGRWLIAEGETIEEYQPLLEVETDKVNTEIPSPATGVLQLLAPARCWRSSASPTRPYPKLPVKEMRSRIHRIRPPPASLRLALRPRHSLPEAMGKHRKNRAAGM